MKKILMFVEKNWVYFIIAIIAISLIIVAFNLLDINIIEWLKNNLMYIVIIIAFILIFITFYFSQKFKNK